MTLAMRSYVHDFIRDISPALYGLLIDERSRGQAACSFPDSTLCTWTTLIRLTE
ncbi:hypothetical protein PILCRDRAFT_810610 [Piloderma croceum F 1598]|uniref:Uncharacterized protein n=1 Tax=Piloderma croceum (strain F 1598) TaxID=765440 RepID=A0A0C3GL77_PILCF|nr:hypothetical protein PILCRDRAFT_810610 [Piloderma croceum F 1598]